jgi:hypothetical protein
MTLDERITALTTDLELLRGMMKDSLQRADRVEARTEQQRLAVLKAIKAYIEAMMTNGGEPEEGRHE